MDKEIVYRVEDGMDREKILCTTYQMRNFYMQFRDGFFTNLDVMNYIQHLAAAHMAKKGMNVLYHRLHRLEGVFPHGYDFRKRHTKCR